MKNKNLLTSFLPMLATAALLIIAPMAREAFYAPDQVSPISDVKVPEGFEISVVPSDDIVGKSVSSQIGVAETHSLKYSGNQLPARYKNGTFSIVQKERDLLSLTFRPVDQNTTVDSKLNISSTVKGLCLTEGKDENIYIYNRMKHITYRVNYKK
ncbi:type 2 periplasmic-binding domain-containing protein [Mucilaginibacter myungsuensis]|uniref:Uncharacterized protein n=1 Tax=Mucilaginibacter myungsuensis TaxID=649104 RepID=A0A929L192_9SPHI|nr:hypothetical protein [Mucilaginibacter myungsuensis]MBE9664405.1 hypothetical protein [Mucilaginibacter myungsuensis]MDN3597116.1 hypothetical protein [Mucilaginibacter myungsuensis]